MNEATKNNAEQAINEQLKRLEWMIPDAQRSVTNAAKEMLRRAEDAVKQCEAMVANQPCSLMWVDFAESDIRVAREAKARLENLYDQRNMLKFFLNPE
jgi:hypothetical protein